MELALLALGVLIVGIVAHQLSGGDQRRKWRGWGIESYKITLRYDSRSLNFDGEILGDSTTLTVIDSEIVNVVGIHADISTIEEYDRFTIEGLFDLASYYSTVHYDSVYGFPTRLGSGKNWVIEVVLFETLA